DLGGALFTIELPLKAPACVEVACAAAAPAAFDIDVDRRLPESGPAPAAGAYNGADGLEQALKLKPDLILSDLMMPGMNGAELARAVRLRRDLDEVPVVMLTARADEEIRVQLLRGGVSDYLIKPFPVEEL